MIQLCDFADYTDHVLVLREILAEHGLNLVIDLQQLQFDIHDANSFDRLHGLSHLVITSFMLTHTKPRSEILESLFQRLSISNKYVISQILMDDLA